MYEDSNEVAMAQRLETVGHTEGDKWDDGSDYDDVSKIYVRGGLKFEYTKSGQLKSGKLTGKRFHRNCMLLKIY